MREPWNWTKEDLESLIGQIESIRLDFKQSRLFEQSHEKIAENLSVVVSAFANTEGGIIVIGMAERREGKARIASHLDEGVDALSWTPERLQQLIESNVSPYLSGIRVRPIAIDPTKPNVAYVIYVPQGATAYQASDHRYYGRSEYEAKSLPDYEVRLRMFRGKVPNAIVRVANCRKRETVASQGDILRLLRRGLEPAPDEDDSAIKSEEIPVSEYQFSLVLENIGEVNISEFKVRIDFSPENAIRLDSYSRAVKDGWLESSHLFGPSRQEQTPMRVNIYPQDTFLIRTHDFRLPSTDSLAENDLIVRWTLYLSNTLPITGQVSIASEFERHNVR